MYLFPKLKLGMAQMFVEGGKFHIDQNFHQVRFENISLP
jgi:hypothetical protein